MLDQLLYKAKWAIRSLVRPVKILGSVQTRCPTERLGSGYGGWTVDPTGLGKDSVVYSVGVGEDVSWDLAMIRRFGCTIHAMDPTPKSIQWVKRQSTPAQFRLHEWGLAGADGELTFYPPENPDHVSHTIVNRPETADRAIRVPVLRLRSIMDRLGHTRIDLLKMDIEGAEYDVVDDLAKGGYDIGQILIEFHHRFPQIGDARTTAAIASLNAMGYRIFCIAPTGEEYSFIRG